MNYDNDSIENEVIHGDCEKVLKKVRDNSVDLICTDPPYGYSFMCKDWDKAVPKLEIWKECFRVLKHGAFCFVMSAPRADVQNAMIQRLIDAGFRVDFTPIYWTYATGFPKSANIGKLVDKKLGIKRKVIGEFDRRSKYDNCERREHRNSPEQFDIGKETKTKITIPATSQAKVLNGSYAGYQPKPAVEVILVAMKPLSEKTFVDQALKNKKGISWLDDCRIPFESESDREKAKTHNAPTGTFAGGKINRGSDTSEYRLQEGRFPSNLLVSNDTLNVVVEEGSFSRYFDLDKWHEKRLREMPKEVQQSYPFLIVPKAQKEEKDMGCRNMKKQGIGHGNLQNSEGFDRFDTEGKNFHPTVKPLKLMEYLVLLGSRDGDLVVDPFVGSGTTCIASKFLGRKFIGIELQKEYWEIANERLSNQPSTLF